MSQPFRGKSDRHEERFRAWHDEFYLRIRNYFVRRGFDEESAKDLTQDTFIRLADSQEDIEGSVEGYIFMIARSLWLNKMRDQQAAKRRSHQVSLEATYERDLATDLYSRSIATPEEEASRRELVRQVREALHLLPPQARRVLQLRLGQDLKYKEIATLLGVSIDSVKVSLWQARQRLRTILREKRVDPLGPP